MSNLIITEKDSDLVKALKDWFNDHYKHFNGYPMEFEYDDVVYDWEECWKLLGWTIKEESLMHLSQVRSLHANNG